LLIDRNNMTKTADSIEALATAIGKDVKALRLKANGRRELEAYPNCVIVGSSNALPSTWGPEFCSTWGLTMRNYAIGGSAFTNANNFLAQLQSASADSAFVNTDVSLVVICDSSNNIRSWNNTGSSTDLTYVASETFAYAKSTFPNARVVCIPVIWPADPIKNVTGVLGGWQYVWNEALMATVSMIQEAALLRGVEVVDQSWTWLSGLPGVMNPDGSVHPNAAGYSMVAQWLTRHLQGGVTRKDTRWQNLYKPPGFGEITAGVPPLRIRREGWQVFVEGGVKVNSAVTSGTTDFATLPDGLSPPNGWELTARQNGGQPTLGVQVYGQARVMRIWGNLPAGYEFFVYGQYSLGG
jgi:hypothetical protein